jgi:hypothetical protein
MEIKLHQSQIRTYSFFENIFILYHIENQWLRISKIQPASSSQMRPFKSKLSMFISRHGPFNFALHHGLINYVYRQTPKQNVVIQKLGL